MDIDVIEKKQAVWWAWGDGGHRFEQGADGARYPVAVAPKVPGQLNNPHPHWCNFSHQITEMPTEFSGWVTRHVVQEQTRAQKNRNMAAFEYDETAFYLRRLHGDTITLAPDALYSMRSARKSVLGLTDKEDDEMNTPMIISELAFYDEDLKFLGSVNLMHVVSIRDFSTLEMHFNFRTVAECVASNLALGPN